MKKLIGIFFITLTFSCTNQPSSSATSNARIDSLSNQLQEIKEKYRPGLGEIMSGIQTHHAKLWFAGINENWKLAAYEIKEIKN